MLIYTKYFDLKYFDNHYADIHIHVWCIRKFWEVSVYYANQYLILDRPLLKTQYYDFCTNTFMQKSNSIIYDIS